jgi:hypothetical protein
MPNRSASSQSVVIRKSPPVPTSRAGLCCSSADAAACLDAPGCAWMRWASARRVAQGHCLAQGHCVRSPRPEPGGRQPEHQLTGDHLRRVLKRLMNAITNDLLGVSGFMRISAWRSPECGTGKDVVLDCRHLESTSLTCLMWGDRAQGGTRRKGDITCSTAGWPAG